MTDEDEAPLPRLAFELVTLFPELFESFLRTSLLGKAITAGVIAVHGTNPRDFAPGRHRQVDDSPYGGGPGMVLRPDPVAAAIDDAEARRGRALRVVLSPSGRLFDQRMAIELSNQRRVMLICGRYEGMDERIPELYADHVLSIGDYVLAGGEVAAEVVMEATARLVPGVLGCGESTVVESFASGRLEHPQWTRPPSFRGKEVPPVLLSGDHQGIARWRLGEALRRTAERRPDLLSRHPLTDAERELLEPGRRPTRRQS
jgi:tRNA (guanine37-N1)-methyltransferase